MLFSFFGGFSVFVFLFRFVFCAFFAVFLVRFFCSFVGFLFVFRFLFGVVFVLRVFCVCFVFLFVLFCRSFLLRLRVFSLSSSLTNFFRLAPVCRLMPPRGGLGKI